MIAREGLCSRCKAVVRAAPFPRPAPARTVEVPKPAEDTAMSRLPLHPDLHAIARERAAELRRQAMAEAWQALRRRVRRAFERQPEPAPCRS